MAARREGAKPVRGDVFYNAAHAIGELLQRTKVNGDDWNARSRDWLRQLFSPQTVLMLAAVIGGFVVSWNTMSTRISVLESVALARLALLDATVTRMDAEHRRAMEQLSDSLVARQDRLRADTKEDDTRRWSEIRDLREHLQTLQQQRK